MSKEIISDELLRKAVARAMKIESAMYERKFALEKEHSFSGKYAEQMKGLLAELNETKECSESKIVDYSVKKISTRVKILLIAAIVMLMGTMTVLAVEPLREKIYELIELIFADHTYVSFTEISQENLDQNGNASSQNEKVNINNYPLKLEKVPEGYTLHIEDDLYEESGVYDYMQIFHNEDEKSILYEQIDINEIDLYSLLVSSDGTPAEEITICGEKAYVLTDEVQRNSVLYPRSDFIFLISGQEDVESLVECLGSLFEEEETNGNEIDSDNYPLKLEKVPEGYDLYSEDDWLEFGFYDYTQIYQNTDGKNLVYQQSLIDEMDPQNFVVTSDGTPAEEIAVCGEIAYLLTDDLEYHTILYPREEFLYKLGGYVDVEILVECLESIFED